VKVRYPVAIAAGRLSLQLGGKPMAADQDRYKQDLSELDAGFIRVLEDLIDALIANGSLRVTDLPPEALEKLAQRKRTRQRLQGALNLISDDDAIF
jgi:hypothetical protein